MKLKINNSGFSLIEILATTVVVCILIIATYPIIILFTKQSKENLYKQNVRELERASIAWATEHYQDLPNDNSDARFKTIKELQDDGLIKKELVKDPRNGKTLNGCVMVRKNKDNQYHAEYQETTCEELGKEYLPEIKVIKEASSTYEVNATEEYQFPKLKATTVRGGKLEISYPKIKKNGKPTTYIDAQKVGDKFEITYQVKDPVNKLTNKYQYTVTIVDTTDPQIQVLGQTKGFDEEISLGEHYEIPTPFVTDNSNQKVKVKVSTDLNTSIPGKYEIVYTATDQNDNLGLLLITVHVTENKLSEQNEIIVTNMEALPGDGNLKKVSNREYIFQGSNPNNYLKFNNELWRIIKIDSNGLKIIKNSPLKEMVWSNKNTTMMEQSLVYTDLNSYISMLPNELTNSIQKRIQWNTGNIPYPITNDMKSLIRFETNLEWKDSMGAGLLNVSDYINASQNECISNLQTCKDKNYLSIYQNVWTMNPVENQAKMYVVGNHGIEMKSVGEKANLYPVLYLRGYQTLMGTGTINDPYEIIK